MLRSLLGGLLAILLILIVWVLAALHLTTASASPIEFPFLLQSRLGADYGPDPIGARIYELRLSIVGDLSSAEEDLAAALPDSLKQLMSQPVPTATPRPPTAPPTKSKTNIPTETAGSSSTQTPAIAVSPTLAPTNMPSRTPTSGTGPFIGPEPDCSLLQITDWWIDDGDQLRAQVSNENGRRAYLTKTVFEWPDVPPPAHVDWMRFDDTYYNHDDYSSPTASEGSWERISGNSSEIWRADFDHEPDEGLYGSFHLHLTFEFPGWGSCAIQGSYYEPGPTSTPTKVPSPTRTLTPGAVPSATATATLAPTLAPSGTSLTPSETPLATTATASPDVTATP